MKVVGYFNTIKKANEAIVAMKQAGFNDTYLDLKNEEMEDLNVTRNIAGTESATSLSELVLKSGSADFERDKTPLTAADPMVSGMAGFDEIADFSYKVAVESNGEDKERVKNMLNSLGALTDI